jgi:hypothetical protein
MGHVEVDIKGQDDDKMVLIMSLIPGRQGPLHANLITLTMIAALVDYLDCHAVVEPFADKRIEQLEIALQTLFLGRAFGSAFPKFFSKGYVIRFKLRSVATWEVAIRRRTSNSTQIQLGNPSAKLNPP